MRPGPGGSAAHLEFAPQRSGQSLELWNGHTPVDWSGAKYLVCDVFHTNHSSAILNLDFYRRSAQAEGKIEQQGGAAAASETSRAPRISPKIGVLPGLRTQVIFPLSYLDGQQIFLPRFPRQLKGTVMGSRLDPEEVGTLRLRLAPVQSPGYESTLTIFRVYLAKELPEALPKASTPYVDKFGQWARRDWPGKVHDEEQLTQRLKSLESRLGDAHYPSGWSRYGGWLDKKFPAKGYFYTHHDGTRWWLVDPDGYAFLSTGMDCVGANVGGMVRGQEDLFAWLPPADGKFADAGSGRGMVDFLKVNLIRVYGTDWRGHWEKLTTGLLKDGGFNTVANWSDLRYARASQVPYVLPMRSFPRTRTSLYRDFPDVYSADYQAASVRFARQLEAFKDDPYLIGYFLSNEPQWAFGRNNLAFEMFATSRASATKTEFRRWVQERYDGSLERFNQAWKLSLASFDDLSDQTFRDMPSDAAEKDFWEFSGLMVKRYIDVVCDAVKEVDPHHLNLGMRYAWVSSDLLYRAGQRFDVFSINGYSFPGPPDTAEVARRSGKPVMIGEFHFGATDRGLPATGIQGTPSQEERGKAYRYYVEHGFSRPEVIGLHYFQWFDQAINGRHDGENYNIGFLDICHQPYPELMDAARQTHERLYRVAAGELEPVAEKPERAPQIYY